MPAVPEGATLPDVQQQVGPLASVHANSPETMFGALAEGGQALAEGTQKFSDVYAQHAMQVAMLNNKAMSDTAYQGYLDEAGDLEAKFNMANRSVSQDDGIQRYNDYKASLEGLRQKYRGTLGNMMAQSLFDQDSRRMQGYMIMNGSRTIAQGVHTFNEAALKGTQATLMARAAASKDPAEQETIKQQIAASQYHWDTVEGLPEEAKQANILNATSTVDLSIINQRMKSDPEGAMTYYRDHQGEITAEHQGIIEERLDQALTVHGGYVAAQSALANLGAGQAQPGSAAAVVGGAAPPATAQGLTAPMKQIETGIVAAFPGTRVTNERRTAVQNAAVGGTANSAHLTGNAVDFHIPAGMSGPEFAAEIKKKFPQANVVYEGPGAAHSTAPHVHVQLGTAGLKGGAPGNEYMAGSAGAQLETLQAHAPSIFAAADANADAYAAKWGLDPIMVRYGAEQRVESEMNRQEYQLKQVTDAARQEVLSAIAAGQPNGQPISDMPTLLRLNPGLQNQIDQLPGSDRREVNNYLRQGANTLTDNRIQQWAMISGMSSDEVMALNPMDKALDLTNGQRTDLINIQRGLRTKAANAQEHDAKINTIVNNKIIHQGLVDAGIVDTNGQILDEQSYQVFVGRMMQKEEQYIAMHPTHKGAIPDQEMINMATPLISRRGATPNWKLGPIQLPFGGSEGEVPPQIPPDRYQALHDLWVQAHPGQGEPTAEQIGEGYERRRSMGLEK